ncbi:HpcH/HpaI aldolase/citrate lyase family protein [Aureimonas mangrovi]|uniref:HpcH/HpaI aldolase/citrate lyase family protein n=1 Tax=Aureimonas mangrovi TaxID=2758041 RepID=UPI00163D47D1|nr:CoA ester lyase [Aureimonas mangrovi]
MPFLPLFVPADRPERFAKAAASGADAVFIDLEDAVAAASKASARDALPRSLGASGPAGSFFVRINAEGTPFFKDDLDAVCGLDIAGVVVPKVEAPETIIRIRERLGPGRVVIAIVESAHGLVNARAIAQAADKVAFGSIDFAVSIGAAHRRDVLLPARSEVVLACALAGQPAPIDGVTTAISDAALITDDAAYALALGFGGKMLIHPAQVAPSVKGFAPTPEETREAQRILAATGGEAVELDGRMVDVPVVEAARAIVARAEAAEERLSRFAG